MQISDIYQIYLSSGMNVSTDTRKLGNGEMFFALKGDNFNGNLFAEQALQNGASYAVVDEGDFENARIILVEDVLTCLQDLAKLHRQTLKTRVLGIGGSNGKTSTKELVVSVLSTEYNVHYTHGNLNNHIGLPLTLLKLRNEHQIAVIEMGANKAGDLQELCGIAEPELALITNIGKEHLLGFGDIEGVAKAEGELFDYISDNGGFAFVNADDAFLKEMGADLSNKVEYGMSESKLLNLSIVPDIQFQYKEQNILSPLMGLHNVQNILACIAVAEFFHLSPEQIKQGIERYAPQNNRSQWVLGKNNNKILLDAYNANPSSVEMALKTFKEIQGNKMVLLGDMFELGAHEAKEHQAILELCEELNFNAVVLIGEAFYKAVSKSNKIHLFQNKTDARQFVSEQARENLSVLIKGSRGMKMEELLDLF
jgi:UDP-N-acetylmuramoyl-tripeptide--D-alanyl-D-alanine ligase